MVAPGAPDTRDAAPNVCRTRPRGRGASEKSDCYPAVIKQVDERHRVIECAGGIQWIIQRKRGGEWKGLSFCCTREALWRDIKCHLDLPRDRPEPAWLLALPASIK
jgi:hypothetical protein